MTASTLQDLAGVCNFRGGEWIQPRVERTHTVYNPSTGEAIGQTPLCGAREVDAAVQAAGKAFGFWSRTPVTKRADVLFRYRALLEEHKEELSRLVTRENGKTLEEARGDVKRGIEVVEFACGIAHLSKGESLPEIAPHIDALTMWEPIGVCAGITPFNFPAMVPMWMFPLAIACGNTFILKPSEKVPFTACRLAKLFHEAGLPPGVFNIVHGGREAVEALCCHPGIAAVSFVGSSAVAKQVYELACRHGKRVQAAGGAKNALVVMPDAEQDATSRAIMGSAFGCAGQRCMAGSVLMCVGDTANAVRDQLVGAIDRLKVDDTSANDAAEMGPVIDGSAQARIRGEIERAVGAGATLTRGDRDTARPRGYFVGPTLLEGVSPEMPVFREEIFGPVLSMLRPSTLEEAIEIMNRLPYGNGATLFTSSGHHARQFARDIQCGMVGINVGVPAPMAQFPFSGWNGSFYGDLHVQGIEGVQFFTRQKVIISRWDSSYRPHQGW